MGFGFGRLRLSSRDFWALTPRELAAAMRGPVHAPEIFTRAALDALMRAYPDDSRSSHG